MKNCIFDKFVVCGGVCTPALRYAYAAQVFAGPEMEKNFNDSEIVGTYVYVCVVSKSQAVCIREQNYILCFYGKQTPNIHIGYDNQMHRMEKTSICKYTQEVLNFLYPF